MSVIYHNPLLLYPDPWMIILTFRSIATFCALNSDVHTSSKNFLIDTSELCTRLGIMWPLHNYSGKAGKSIRNCLLDCMVCSFGYPT